MTGVGREQLAELDGSAAFMTRLPGYAAHFGRAGITPEPTWIADGQLDGLTGLLGSWRDTVDEVGLVPVSATAPGPARALVDAAIAAV